MDRSPAFSSSLMCTWLLVAACGDPPANSMDEAGSGDDLSSDADAGTGAGNDDDGHQTTPSDDGSAADSDSPSESESGDNSGEEDTPVDDAFSDIEIAALPQVQTVARVSWSQAVDLDAVWIEFSFETDEWMQSPERELAAGDHSEMMLGVPEGLSVEIRVVGRSARTEFVSPSLTHQNPMAPAAMPRPTIELFDADKASPNRWMLGESSEKGDGGYGGPHWVYIIDRKGRVVWYLRPAGGERGELNQGFWPRLARDGTHITLDQQIRRQDGELLFTTLDLEQQRTVELPGQGDCYDLTDDGHILYNRNDTLVEISPSGSTREVWQCDIGRCYANTVSWDPVYDAVLMSFPYSNLVVQIDRTSGEVLRRFGDGGDFSFEPADQGLEFNHWAHITDSGTFMVSTHLPGTRTHLFTEYEIDDASKTLRSKWSFGRGTQDWADERGMAMRIPGGGVLGNYGPSGVIVEVSDELEVAWRVEFGEKLLGNNILIDDLYALNRGPLR